LVQGSNPCGLTTFRVAFATHSLVPRRHEPRRLFDRRAVARLPDPRLGRVHPVDIDRLSPQTFDNDDRRLEMQSTYATYELASSRQQDLLREAKEARLAAQARARTDEGKPSQWEASLGRVRHVFAVFSALPRNPQVRIARDAAGS
jgi:hypothetical protein